MTQEFSAAWKKLHRQTPEVGEPLGTTPRFDRFHIIGGKQRSLALVINDLHIPFHDKMLVESVKRFAADAAVDTLILNGDILDCYNISSFVKSGKRKFTFSDEIVQSRAILDEFRNCLPNSVIHFTEGNHENRLRRYLDSDAKALADLPCLEWNRLLGLDELEIKWHGAEGFKLNRNFLVLHGDRVSKHSGATARMEFERHLVSGISGHTHRAGRFDVVGHGAEYHWTENGCLCDLNPEYISGRPNWQHAISLVEYNRDRAHTRLIRIHGRKLVVDGVRY